MSTLSSPKGESHEISANFESYKVKIQNIPKYYYELDEEIKNVFEDWKVNHPLELGYYIGFMNPYIEIVNKKKVIVAPLCFRKRIQEPEQGSNSSLVIPGIGFVIIDVKDHNTLFKTPNEVIRSNIKQKRKAPMVKLL